MLIRERILSSDQVMCQNEAKICIGLVSFHAEFINGLKEENQKKLQ
jgi:hypothetical protein